jgi:hypothetical protein
MGSVRRRRRTVRELLELAGEPHCKCTTRRHLVKQPFGLFGVWCLRCMLPVRRCDLPRVIS